MGVSDSGQPARTLADQPEISAPLRQQEKAREIEVPRRPRQEHGMIKLVDALESKSAGVNSRSLQSFTALGSDCCSYRSRHRAQSDQLEPAAGPP